MKKCKDLEVNRMDKKCCDKCGKQVEELECCDYCGLWYCNDCGVDYCCEDCAEKDLNVKGWE